MGLGILAEPCVALCLVSGCRWMLLLLFAVVSVFVSVSSSVSVAVVVATTCCLQCLVTIVFQPFFLFSLVPASDMHMHGYIDTFVSFTGAHWSPVHHCTGGVLNTHTHTFYILIMFSLRLAGVSPHQTPPPPCGRTAFNYSCVTFQFCYINKWENGTISSAQVQLVMKQSPRGSRALPAGTLTIQCRLNVS